MAVEIIITPEAQADLAEAYGWYEARPLGLGEEFLSAVDACIHAIGRLPSIFREVHAEYRRATVRRFPYAVFFD